MVYVSVLGPHLWNSGRDYLLYAAYFRGAEVTYYADDTPETLQSCCSHRSDRGSGSDLHSTTGAGDGTKQIEGPLFVICLGTCDLPMVT